MQSALTAAMLWLLAGSTAGWSQATRLEPPAGTPEAGLVLEGVIVAASPQASVALIRRVEAERGRAVHVGETVYGWTLVAVSEEHALLQKEGESIELILDAGGAGPAKGPDGRSSKRSHEEERGDNNEDPHRVAAKHGEAKNETETWVVRRLDRAGAKERLKKEMPLILSQTGLVAREKAEGSRGLRITRIPEGTLLSELGLLPGDVLLSVNDVAVDTPAALRQLFPTLEEEEEIRVVVERSGRIVKLAYDMH